MFKDKQYDQAQNVLTLLNVENHYHAVTSIPELLNRSYFCRLCEKGYDHEAAKEHNRMGQNCKACRRGNKACPNFMFYGPECFHAHQQKPRGGQSICEQFRKCLECCKVYGVKGKKKHHCYQAKCRNCGKVTYVNHDCYIQPIAEEKKKKQVSEVLEDEDLEADMTDQEYESSPAPLKPLLCYVDTECSLNEENVFEVYKVGWSYGDDDEFFEANTVDEFLENVNSKVGEDGQERQVFAHNMRGFDSMFIQDTLYGQGCCLEKILSQRFEQALNLHPRPLEVTAKVTANRLTVTQSLSQVYYAPQGRQRYAFTPVQETFQEVQDNHWDEVEITLKELDGNLVQFQSDSQRVLQLDFTKN